MLSKNGRTYEKGKALTTDLRSNIIDTIVQEGGDPCTGFFVGNYAAIGRKYNISGQTVKNIWDRISQDEEIGPRDKKGSQNPPHLAPGDCAFFELLKKDSPSMPYKKIHDAVKQYCNVLGDTSVSAIGRAVRKRMSSGPMSWKRTSNRPTYKLSPENINYCQDFLNYMSTVDPYCIKCFDEAGFELPDVANKNYGHSNVGVPCIQIDRHIDSPNVTLMYLAGLNGVSFANTYDGATTTLDFLDFFGQAANSFTRNGQPVLEYGDHILLDNHGTHHNEGGYVLGEWMDRHGIEVVYLPTYSPELNPVELAFNKMKYIAKREDIRNIFYQNVHAGIFSCIGHITESDMRGFYRYTNHIFV